MGIGASTKSNSDTVPGIPGEPKYVFFPILQNLLRKTAKTIQIELLYKDFEIKTNRGKRNQHEIQPYSMFICVPSHLRN